MTELDVLLDVLKAELEALKQEQAAFVYAAGSEAAELKDRLYQAGKEIGRMSLEWSKEERVWAAKVAELEATQRTLAERRLLDICSAALKAWEGSNPHDDFRFGMPGQMALGKALSEALRREAAEESK